jgi:hypothetical protein
MYLSGLKLSQILSYKVKKLIFPLYTYVCETEKVQVEGFCHKSLLLRVSHCECKITYSVRICAYIIAIFAQNGSCVSRTPHAYVAY